MEVYKYLEEHPITGDFSEAFRQLESLQKIFPRKDINLEIQIYTFDGPDGEYTLCKDFSFGVEIDDVDSNELLQFFHVPPEDRYGVLIYYSRPYLSSDDEDD